MGVIGTDDVFIAVQGEDALGNGLVAHRRRCRRRRRRFQGRRLTRAFAQWPFNDNGRRTHCFWVFPSLSLSLHYQLTPSAMGYRVAIGPSSVGSYPLPTHLLPASATLDAINRLSTNPIHHCTMRSLKTKTNWKQQKKPLWKKYGKW